jgi:hypothetical protein
MEAFLVKAQVFFISSFVEDCLIRGHPQYLNHAKKDAFIFLRVVNQRSPKQTKGARKATKELSKRSEPASAPQIISL